MGSHNYATNDQIKRLLTGFFWLRPNKPKYDYTWDVSIVLNFIENNYLDLSNLDGNATSISYRTKNSNSLCN